MSIATGLQQAELNLSYTRSRAGRRHHRARRTVGRQAGHRPTTNGSLLTTINQLSTRSGSASALPSRIWRSCPAAARPRCAGRCRKASSPTDRAYPARAGSTSRRPRSTRKLGTQQLRAEFDESAQQLLPGQFVACSHHRRRSTTTCTWCRRPRSSDRERALVFVVDADGKAQPTPVQTGDWVGADWTVLSGLKAGDRVIVDNLLKLRPGAPVTRSAAGSGVGGRRRPPRQRARPQRRRSSAIPVIRSRVLHRPADLRGGDLDLHRDRRPAPRCACCRSRSTRRSRRRSVTVQRRSTRARQRRDARADRRRAARGTAINGVEDMIYMSSTLGVERRRCRSR